MALLSRNKNAEAQNYDFDKKQEKYFISKKGISPFVLTTQVLQQSEWTPAVIKQRQEDCLENLRKIWRL
ncbi:GmrSD restriction endonuclease domain-containing protein [Nostoc sp.]|uniref:GmrSD restriction endonuclease domain-containing protein n=1 Tax=Nostoc sp. TaxID=1180 RepID=UPI003FA60EC0